MFTIRMSLISMMFVGLMSVGALADEPTKEEKEDTPPVTTAKIEAAEKKVLADEEALQKIIKGLVCIGRWRSSDDSRIFVAFAAKLR